MCEDNEDRCACKPKLVSLDAYVRKANERNSLAYQRRRAFDQFAGEARSRIVKAAGEYLFDVLQLDPQHRVTVYPGWPHQSELLDAAKAIVHGGFEGADQDIAKLTENENGGFTLELL